METTILLTVGLLMILFSYMIGIQKNITILHAYMYKNVKRKHVHIYCTLIGLALCIFGVSLCLGLFVPFFDNSILTIVIPAMICIYAWMKYNR